MAYECKEADIDAVSRKKIIEEIDQSFFVEAGAGSGKTTMLVKRMLSMVKAGIPIEKICAITFTKAASREFYRRFQKELMDNRNDDLCAKALNNIDLCFMGTIDSFCSMILSEHPVEAGIPSDATLFDDDQLRNYYKQLYIRISHGDEGDALKNLSETFRGLFRSPENAFADGMKILMDHRNVDFHYDRLEKYDIDAEFSKDRRRLLSALDAVNQHPEIKYGSYQKNLDAWEKLPVALNVLHRKWSYNFPSVIFNLKNISSLRISCNPSEIGMVDGINYFEDHETKGKYKWTELHIGDLLDRLENFRYNASMEFLTSCVPVCEQDLTAKGVLTFFDYLYDLRNMLKKDAEQDGELIDYIYNRHSYFLIDEFQDTNPLQAEIFFYLTAEKPNTVWYQCKPRKGSLFIVGDPKQSIYRFRSADVTSYLRVKKLFEKDVGEILYLTRNFRSTRKLCEYFNVTFSSLLPKATETQSKYEMIPLSDKPVENDNLLGGTYTYESYFGKAVDDHPEMTDEKQVLKIIQTLVNNPKIKISDAGTERMLRYGDIMVITKAKNTINNFYPLFETNGIPMHIEGTVPFANCSCLAAVADIFRVLAFSDDDNGTAYKRALYKVIHGPLGSMFGKSEEEAQQVLSEFEKNAVTLTPAALFEEILIRFPVFRYVSADGLDAMYYAMELLLNAVNTGAVTSLQDASEYLDRLTSGEIDEERSLNLTRNTDQVHIANLHKVKGLEAPVVILAYSYPSLISTDSPFSPIIHIKYLKNGTEGFLFKLKDSDDPTRIWFETNAYVNEKNEEEGAVKDENKRLLYVAATRAKNALIINKSIAKSGHKESVKTFWQGLLDNTMGDVFDRINETPVNAMQKTKEIPAGDCVDERPTPPEKIYDETYMIRKPSDLHVRSISENNERDSQESVEQAASEKIGSHALLGTLIHRLMEILISSRGKMKTDQIVRMILAEYDIPASDRNLYDAILKNAAVTMKNGGFTQVSGAPQDLLKELEDAEEVHCEVPFCYQTDEKSQADVPESGKGKTVWYGVIDLLYKKHGWHIIDYKTNKDDSDLNEKYKEQPKAYQHAIQNLIGEKSDAQIYHINT